MRFSVFYRKFRSMSKNVLSILKTGKFWREFILMTVAMFISAAAVYYFLIPSKIVVGSVSGLSIVVTQVLSRIGVQIDVSVMIFIINAILLILAYVLVGHEFGIKTVYTALVLGPMISVWKKILPVESVIAEGCTSIMNDAWFDLIVFILILSLAQSILFRINASTGGLDILAKIFNKFCKIDMGMSVTIAGAIICLSAFAINPVRMVIIGLVGTWINGVCVDYFMGNMSHKKRVCIISEDYERIRRFIVEELGRDCTLYDVKGGTSLKEMTEIEAIVAKSEFVGLMKFISDNNIKAFVTSSTETEVHGYWREKR